jgi:hypothetical protein
VASIAQLVRAPDCGLGGRGFEPRCSPFIFSMAEESLLRIETSEAAGKEADQS